MKDKKTWIIVGSVILILIIVTSIIFLSMKDNSNNNKDDNKKSSLIEEVAKNSGKETNEYKKFLGGEILNENTYFNEYTFISNNKAYIFDPAILKNDELSYVKVYDIPEDLKVINIGIPYGPDIHFITSNDEYYTIRDNNTDNKVQAGFNMFANTKYELKKMHDSYSKETYGEKLDYDLIFNLHIVKDNILYTLTIPFDS